MVYKPHLHPLNAADDQSPNASLDDRLAKLVKAAPVMVSMRVNLKHCSCKVIITSSSL